MIRRGDKTRPIRQSDQFLKIEWSAINQGCNSISGKTICPLIKIQPFASAKHIKCTKEYVARFGSIPQRLHVSKNLAIQNVVWIRATILLNPRMLCQRLPPKVRVAFFLPLRTASAVHAVFILSKDKPTVCPVNFLGRNHFFSRNKQMLVAVHGFNVVFWRVNPDRTTLHFATGRSRKRRLIVHHPEVFGKIIAFLYAIWHRQE